MLLFNRRCVRGTTVQREKSGTGPRSISLERSWCDRASASRWPRRGRAGRRPVARYRIGNRLLDLRICWTGGWRVPSALICLRRTYPPRWTRPCVGDDRVQWNLFTVILLTLPAAFHGRMSSLWTASCVVTRTASDSSMNRSVMQSGSWRCRTRETSGTSGSGFGFRTLGGRSAETPSARSFIPRRRWRAKFAARVSNCSGAAARGPGALTYT